MLKKKKQASLTKSQSLLFLKTAKERKKTEGQNRRLMLQTFFNLLPFKFKNLKSNSFSSLVTQVGKDEDSILLLPSTFPSPLGNSAKLGQKGEGKTHSWGKEGNRNQSNKSLVKTFPFWNQCFDKNRLKNFVLWFLVTYGEYRTVELIEEFKNIGFEYATKAGISLGIDDLKIPPKKSFLIVEAEKHTKSALNQYNRGEITGVERFQKMIDTWHRTSEILKQEVIENFELTDTLNPVYMMAFSGARGNISQVRQLVGMRGLMANPQGQILDFPIQSNFREGLSLTEYIISTYGARKGIVDTALRTANAGYLTRRLVDVAQHVIVSNFDCGTYKGIFLNDMKEGNKVLYSLQNRLVGRILGKNVFSNQDGASGTGSYYKQASKPEILEGGKEASQFLRSADKVNNKEVSIAGFPSLPLGEKAVEGRGASSFESNPNQKGFTAFFSEKKREQEAREPLYLRNIEISINLAVKLCKISKKIFVRSPLTCETQKSVCQLCYGWSLAQGNLVSIGEAVGVVAAQSVGEPGTQLTMRTFHTGGVFTGDTTDQIRALYNGFVKYLEPIAGTLIRTPEGKIAFLTKTEGFIEVLPDSAFDKREGENYPHQDQKKGKTKIYKIPSYTLLFARHGENVFEKQVIAQISNISRQQNKRDDAEFTINSEMEGEFYSEKLTLLEKNPAFNTYEGGAESSDSSETELEACDWGYAWILSGKVYQLPVLSCFFPQPGDFLNRKSLMNQIQLKTTNGGGKFGFLETKINDNLILNKPVFFLEINKMIYKKVGYLFTLPEYCFFNANFLASPSDPAFDTDFNHLRTGIASYTHPFSKSFHSKLGEGTGLLLPDFQALGQGKKLARNSLKKNANVFYQSYFSKISLLLDKKSRSKMIFERKISKKYGQLEQKKFLTSNDLLFSPSAFLSSATKFGAKKTFAAPFSSPSLLRKDVRKAKINSKESFARQSNSINLGKEQKGIDFSAFNWTQTQFKNSSANWSQNLSLFLEWFPHSKIDTGGEFLKDFRTYLSTFYIASMWPKNITLFKDPSSFFSFGINQKNSLGTFSLPLKGLESPHDFSQKLSLWGTYKKNLLPDVNVVNRPEEKDLISIFPNLHLHPASSPSFPRRGGEQGRGEATFISMKKKFYYDPGKYSAQRENQLKNELKNEKLIWVSRQFYEIPEKHFSKTFISKTLTGWRELNNKKRNLPFLASQGGGNSSISLQSSLSKKNRQGVKQTLFSSLCKNAFLQVARVQSIPLLKLESIDKIKEKDNDSAVFRFLSVLSPYNKKKLFRFLEEPSFIKDEEKKVLKKFNKSWNQKNASRYCLSLLARNLKKNMPGKNKTNCICFLKDLPINLFKGKERYFQENKSLIKNQHPFFFLKQRTQKFATYKNLRKKRELETIPTAGFKQVGSSITVVHNPYFRIFLNKDRIVEQALNIEKKQVSPFISKWEGERKSRPSNNFKYFKLSYNSRIALYPHHLKKMEVNSFFSKPETKNLIIPLVSSILKKNKRIALFFETAEIYNRVIKKKSNPSLISITKKSSSSFSLKNNLPSLPPEGKKERVERGGISDKFFHVPFNSFTPIKAKIKEKVRLTFFSAFCLHNFQQRFQLKSANLVSFASVFFGPNSCTKPAPLIVAEDSKENLRFPLRLRTTFISKLRKRPQALYPLTPFSPSHYPPSSPAKLFLFGEGDKKRKKPGKRLGLQGQDQKKRFSLGKNVLLHTLPSTTGKRHLFRQFFAKQAFFLQTGTLLSPFPTLKKKLLASKKKGRAFFFGINPKKKASSTKSRGCFLHFPQRGKGVLLSIAKQRGWRARVIAKHSRRKKKASKRNRPSFSLKKLTKKIGFNFSKDINGHKENRTISIKIKKGWLYFPFSLKKTLNSFIKTAKQNKSYISPGQLFSHDLMFDNNNIYVEWFILNSVRFLGNNELKISLDSRAAKKQESALLTNKKIHSDADFNSDTDFNSDSDKWRDDKTSFRISNISNFLNNLKKALWSKKRASALILLTEAPHSEFRNDEKDLTNSKSDFSTFLPGKKNSEEGWVQNQKCRFSPPDLQQLNNLFSSQNHLTKGMLIQKAFELTLRNSNRDYKNELAELYKSNSDSVITESKKFLVFPFPAKLEKRGEGLLYTNDQINLGVLQSQNSELKSDVGKLCFFSKKIYIWQSSKNSNLDRSISKKPSIRILVELRKNKPYNSMLIRDQLHGLLLNKQKKSSLPLQYLDKRKFLLVPSDEGLIPQLDFKVQKTNLNLRKLGSLLPQFDFNKLSFFSNSLLLKYAKKQSKKILESKSERNLALEPIIAPGYAKLKGFFEGLASNKKERSIIKPFLGLLKRNNPSSLSSNKQSKKQIGYENPSKLFNSLVLNLPLKRTETEIKESYPLMFKKISFEKSSLRKNFPFTSHPAKLGEDTGGKRGSPKGKERISSIIFKKPVNTSSLLIGYNLPYGCDLDFNIPNVHLNAKLHPPGVVKVFSKTLRRKRRFSSFFHSKAGFFEGKENNKVLTKQLRALIPRPTSMSQLTAFSPLTLLSAKTKIQNKLAQASSFVARKKRELSYLFAQPCFSFFMSKKLTPPYFIPSFILRKRRKKKLANWGKPFSFLLKNKNKLLLNKGILFSPIRNLSQRGESNDNEIQKSIKKKKICKALKRTKLKTPQANPSGNKKQSFRKKLIFTLDSNGESLYDNKFISSNPFIKSSYLSTFEGEFVKVMPSDFAAQSTFAFDGVAPELNKRISKLGNPLLSPGKVLNITKSEGLSKESSPDFFLDGQPIIYEKPELLPLLIPTPSFTSFDSGLSPAFDDSLVNFISSSSPLYPPLGGKKEESETDLNLGKGSPTTDDLKRIKKNENLNGKKEAYFSSIILTKENLICYSFNNINLRKRKGSFTIYKKNIMTSFSKKKASFKSTRDNLSKEICSFNKRNLNKIFIRPHNFFSLVEPLPIKLKKDLKEELNGEEVALLSENSSSLTPLFILLKKKDLLLQLELGDIKFTILSSLKLLKSRLEKNFLLPVPYHSVFGSDSELKPVSGSDLNFLKINNLTEGESLIASSFSPSFISLAPQPAIYPTGGEVVKQEETGEGRGEEERDIEGKKIILKKVLKIRGLVIGFSKENGSEARGRSLFKNKLSLGEFLVYGDKIIPAMTQSPVFFNSLAQNPSFPNPELEVTFNNKIKSRKGVAIPISGQIIHISIKKITLRRAQPIFISPKSILHVSDGNFIFNNNPVMTLTYQRLKTGDIVQGIPKVEQYLEARITKQGRLFRDCLPNLLKGLFKRYRGQLPLERAVRQSFYKIQQIIVDGVLRVYRSQGVTIADKHLEVVVKQMTSKVKIINGAQTGFFPGEIVDLQFVERINLALMKKIQYEPLILGITRAALEVDSFLSAASFQQTTRVLSSAAIEKRKDFLKGLKENILLGNLMPAGTGYLVYLEDLSFKNS